jgi:hypothetical protein
VIKKDLHSLKRLLMAFAVLSLFSGVSVAQQRVDYLIDAKLDTKRKWIAGDIAMVYHNNSNDTLNEIWMHLWPNAYSSHQTAFARQAVDMGYLSFHYTKRYGKIDSISFAIDSKPATAISSAESPDMLLLIPETPVLPGQKVVISSPFRTKLPPIVSRSGFDKNFYAATQWYPKPAVYDQTGWHPMPYLEQGEFYSEFGRFEVNLTLPQNLILAATGHVIDTVITNDTLSEWHTYKIVQDNVHDFAWFAAKDYVVKADTVELPSGKQVVVQAMMKDSPALADKAIRYTAQTLQMMSEYVGEYPYDVCTAVMGPAGMGSGMEYPTIFSVEDNQLLEVTVHEAIHNWWYGMLANNERASPWLDESITSYYEKRVVKNIQSNEKNVGMLENLKGSGISKAFGLNRLPSSPMEKNIILYQQRLNQQQAISSKSEELTPVNYYAMIYAKGALALQYLEAYLGTERFDAAMKAFYNKMLFKHFEAQDLQFYFESVTGESLDWFFKGVISSPENTDVIIKHAERRGDSLIVTLKNNTSYPLPIPLTYQNKDLVTHHTFWTQPFEGDYVAAIPFCDSSWQIVVDGDWLTFDNNRSNNYFKLQKGLPRFEPVRVQLFGAPEDPSRDQLFLAPVLGGNAYDGFLLGLAFYNRVLPAKQLDFEVVPMFGFKSSDFNWIANFSYHFLPKKHQPLDIELGIHNRSFNMNDRPGLSRFYKMQPFLNITFDKSLGNRGPVHQLKARHVRIWEDFYTGTRDSITEQITFDKDVASYCVNELSYKFTLQDALYPVSAQSSIQFNKNFIKQSFEIMQGLRYTQKGAMVKLRLFAGAFLFRNPDVSFRSNRRFGFNLGGISGFNDYLYDQHFMGRNEQDGFLSQQIGMGDGNFKVITLNQGPQEGQTVNWLMAANLKVDFPIKKVPVKFFADFGYSVDKELGLLNMLPVKQFHYDLGLCVSFFSEAIEVYFPLAMSENFRTYYKSNLPKFGQRISFSINMDKLNIHKQLRSVPFNQLMSSF